MTSSQQSHANAARLIAGAAAVDVTPNEPVFLYGYPHVPRTSTGTNDPLLATALYLEAERQRCVIVSVDIIFLSKRQIDHARRLITKATGIPIEAILISATHTHSGPVSVAMISNRNDSVVPLPCDHVINGILAGIVRAAVDAAENAEPARLGFSSVNVPGLGGNRHAPSGPSLSTIPVMAVKSVATEDLLAMHYVVSVHPTVLHEDSTVISGDFLGLARQELQRRLASDGCSLPVVHQLGAAGNQSPRHVVESNTLSEAQRLGELLAKAVELAVQDMQYTTACVIGRAGAEVVLPLRKVPDLENASRRVEDACRNLQRLRAARAARAAIRTAECDVFGAEETRALAEAAEDGQLAEVAHACLPAEIQLLKIGPRTLVAWPGEIFVEFALKLQLRFPEAVLVTLANGELQGYLTDEQAVRENWYEASNAIFASPHSAERLLDATCALLGGLP